MSNTPPTPQVPDPAEEPDTEPPPEPRRPGRLFPGSIPRFCGRSPRSFPDSRVRTFPTLVNLSVHRAQGAGVTPARAGPELLSPGSSSGRAARANHGIPSMVSRPPSFDESHRALPWRNRALALTSWVQARVRAARRRLRQPRGRGRLLSRLGSRTAIVRGRHRCREASKLEVQHVVAEPKWRQTWPERPMRSASWPGSGATSLILEVWSQKIPKRLRAFAINRPRGPRISKFPV
jgi:hypothetical protein